MFAGLPAVLVLMGSECTSSHRAQPVAALGVSDRPPVASVTDRDFLRGMGDRAMALRDEGHLVHTSELAGHLDRQTCSIDLPSPVNNGPVRAPGELFAMRVPGVLVVGVVGNCPDPNCQYPGHLVMRSIATAFALTADGVCVSNRHVFDDSGDDVEFMIVATAQGVVYPVREVLASSRRDDAAIFRVDLRDDRLDPIPLRAGAAVGESVAVISHPDEHCFTLTTGMIARRAMLRGSLAGGGGGGGARRNIPAPHAVAPDQPMEPDGRAALTLSLEITAEYAIGSSGGPLLDARRNAVGMVCATRTLYADPERRRDPQAVVRTCVPAESILALVKRP